MDPRQQQAAAAIQKMAQMDPEFVKMQKIAEMKALIHEHTSRCWETCNLGDQARNSSLSTYFSKNPRTSSKYSPGITDNYAPRWTRLDTVMQCYWVLIFFYLFWG